MAYFGVVLPIVIISALVVLHLLVSDINKTRQVPHVAHRGRFTFGEIREIKRLHRELLPNSWKYEVFTILEIINYTFAGLMVAGFIAFLIYSKTEAPY